MILESAWGAIVKCATSRPTDDQKNGTPNEHIRHRYNAELVNLRRSNYECQAQTQQSQARHDSRNFCRSVKGGILSDKRYLIGPRARSQTRVC